jgi:hypothetical protein
MLAKTFLAVVILATAVAAAPVPNDIWGVSPPTDSLSDIFGSPFVDGRCLSVFLGHAFNLDSAVNIQPSPHFGHS